MTANRIIKMIIMKEIYKDYFDINETIMCQLLKVIRRK